MSGPLGLLEGGPVVLNRIFAILVCVSLLVNVSAAVIGDSVRFPLAQCLKFFQEGYIFILQELVLGEHCSILIPEIGNLVGQFLVAETGLPELLVELWGRGVGVPDFTDKQCYLTIEHLVHQIHIAGQCFNFIPDVGPHRLQFLMECLIYWMLRRIELAQQCVEFGIRDVELADFLQQSGTQGFLYHLLH